MRRNLTYSVLAITASALFFLAGCSTPEKPGPSSAPSTEAPAQPGTLEQKIEATNDTITIGTFNLMNYGQSKTHNDKAMAIIATSLRKFDIAAVQEIEDVNGTAIIALRDRINAVPPAAHYEVLVGDRVGTRAKEQYAFFYNTATITYSGESYTYNDVNRHFERPPFVAKFSAKVNAGKGFDFTLVDIHTKPDNATSEIMALEDVIADAQVRLKDKDVIALGDYNAGGSYFNTGISTGLRDTKTYLWIIPDGTDTTVATGNSNTYDRMVAPAQFTTEDYTGQWGVIKFDRENGLSNTEAKTISDHYPVYAVFFTTHDTD
jgi:endonuclease/exonuclease/phosphatase family metal-dependent hydrolase